MHAIVQCGLCDNCLIVDNGMVYLLVGNVCFVWIACQTQHTIWNRTRCLLVYCIFVNWSLVDMVDGVLGVVYDNGVNSRNRFHNC